MSQAKIASEAVENYLKAIHHLSPGDTGASSQDIAAQVGVSLPGVSKMLRHLAELDYIRYTPYHPVHLTVKGRKIALEVIRHHRLLELYLVRNLGFGWEEVHAEAERLEHYISEEFEERIARLLENPEYDPHGDPIPARDLTIAPPVTLTLDSQPADVHLIVSRVTDEDTELLRYLDARGVRPGAQLHLFEREPFGGSLWVRINSQEERISPAAARHIFVQPIENQESGK